jgi:hypothetical protein
MIIEGKEYTPYVPLNPEQVKELIDKSKNEGRKE